MLTVALPLPIRNRLNDLILAAFDDPNAKEVLVALGGFCRGETSERLLALDFFHRGADGAVRLSPWAEPHRVAICERARAYQEVLARAQRLPPQECSDPMIRAALLFDTRCYFETHEILEPLWMRAEGRKRQALQGLIQVAVGFQHLANGNVVGSRLLLEEGLGRLKANGSVLDLALGGWIEGVTRCLDEIVALGARATESFDWRKVPMWPVREPFLSR